VARTLAYGESLLKFSAPPGIKFLPGAKIEMPNELGPGISGHALYLLTRQQVLDLPDGTVVGSLSEGMHLKGSTLKRLHKFAPDELTPYGFRRHNIPGERQFPVERPATPRPANSGMAQAGARLFAKPK
jgi:hypothetical protein